MTYLQKEGFPRGLIRAMMDLKKDCAKQIFVIDNSEPMNQKDGHVLSKDSNGNICFAAGTRWEELQKCVRAHIQISNALAIPTTFRLLNPTTEGTGTMEFTIGTATDTADSVTRALEIMEKTKPHSQSPLTESILKIVTEVEGMQPELTNSGKHVAVVICTDGVPSDSTREFLAEQLKKLEPLPVQIVVRLCTDEPSVVEYYNQLDKSLDGIRLDVLDDFQGEALETCKANPWLTYSLPLHRAREMGFNSPVLDNLDEGPLSPLEQKELCELLFGKDKMRMCPAPELDAEGFQDHVKTLQEEETKQWVSGLFVIWKFQ